MRRIACVVLNHRAGCALCGMYRAFSSSLPGTLTKPCVTQRVPSCGSGAPCAHPAKAIPTAHGPTRPAAPEPAAGAGAYACVHMCVHACVRVCASRARIEATLLTKWHVGIA
eukprot:1161182-Pelagomonas_calceolata.AAC.12